MERAIRLSTGVVAIHPDDVVSGAAEDAGQSVVISSGEDGGDGEQHSADGVGPIVFRPAVGVIGRGGGRRGTTIRYPLYLGR